MKFHKSRQIPILCCSFYWIATNLLSGAFKMYAGDAAKHKWCSGRWVGSTQWSGPSQGADTIINKAVTSVAWGPVVQPKCQPGWPLKWGQSFTASAAEFSIMSLCCVSLCVKACAKSAQFKHIPPLSSGFPPACCVACTALYPLQLLLFFRWHGVLQGRPELEGQDKKTAQNPSFVKLTIPKKC